MSDYPTPTPVPAASGLSDNAAGALAYVTIIPAIIFLVVAPYNTNPFIKYHAWQNILLAAFLFVISLFNIIPILGQLVFLLGFIVAFVFWVIAILSAYKGQKYHIPVIGNFAEKLAAS